ncbi:MAG: hypothetical protein PVI86_19810 [Phycisphaerae bacterium]|jgi:hypothetical protein
MITVDEQAQWLGTEECCIVVNQCCGAGHTCCGDAGCCPVGDCCANISCCDAGENCCENGSCCDEPCGECLDDGELDVTNATIELTPPVACLGDTLTFTVSGVTDTGGVPSSGPTPASTNPRSVKTKTTSDRANQLA